MKKQGSLHCYMVLMTLHTEKQNKINPTALISTSNCQLERILSLRKCSVECRSFLLSVNGRREGGVCVRRGGDCAPPPPPITPKLSNSAVMRESCGPWGLWGVADGTNRAGHFLSTDQTNKLETAGKRKFF